MRLPGGGRACTPRLVNARVRLAWVACCVLWGSTWSFIKLGLHDLPPLHFAALRMTLAAAVLVPFAVRAGLVRTDRRELTRVAAVGLIQIGLPYALLFAAQQWVASGLAAILFATFPIWLLLLARALLPGQPLSPAKLVAAALGIAGVAVLQLPTLRMAGTGSRAALGGSLIVAAAVLVALANVLVRRGFEAVPPVVLTFVQVLAGAALLATLAGTLEAGRSAAVTPRAGAAVVYLAVLGTAVPYLLLFWLLPRVPVAAIGAIPLVDTTIAVCIGSLLLREPIGWHLLAGGSLVLLAAALANNLVPSPLESRPTP
jgi:drug/metabolite transporter (DMT)-like permease